MFKDTKEGQTHHDKDACYKCEVCGAHFFRDIISQHACITKKILKDWDKEIDNMKNIQDKKDEMIGTMNWLYMFVGVAVIFWTMVIVSLIWLL